jgi:hypothetical protein
MELRLDAFDAPRAVDKALTLINTRNKALSSLQEFRAHVYNEPIDIALREKMRRYGWTFEVAQQTELEEKDLDMWQDLC